MMRSVLAFLMRKNTIAWIGGGGIFFIGFIFILKFVVGLSFIVQLLTLLPGEHHSGVNILLVGTDEVEGTQRSDAISVIHINEELSHVRALSIPRDTRVNIDGHGPSKINHAYAYGGISLLKQTVSNFLSIPIHHHVVVDAQGVKSIIDAVGGISIHIDQPMKYDDYAGNLHINFDKGLAHLNGEKLIQYVRFRSNSKGDIGRIERHQQVAKLLFDQIFQVKNLAISPKLIRIFISSVKTDLGIAKMSHYLNVFLRKQSELKVQFLTVPGSVRLIEGVSYWRPNIVYLDHLISKVFVDYALEPMTTRKKAQVPTHLIRRVNQQLAMDDKQLVHATPFTIEVLNGNGTAGLASQTAKFLRSKQLRVTSISNSQSFDYQETLIVDWKGNIEKSLKLAKLLNIKPSNIVVYDRKDKPLDITLVLGKNWTSGYLEGLMQ